MSFDDIHTQLSTLTISQLEDYQRAISEELFSRKYKEKLDEKENSAKVVPPIEGDTPLHRAARDGTADEIRGLLKNSADPNIKNIKNSEGDRPWRVAIKYSRPQEIFTLLRENVEDEPRAFGDSDSESGCSFDYFSSDEF